MIGIYMWTNLINGKKYIGQSVNIERRKNQHISSAGKYTTKFSKALYKYGLNNFKFEILEITNVESLNRREAYWINYYNTLDDSCGYNILEMTEEGAVVVGEKNLNAHLTEEEVLEIRNRVHLNKEYPKEVYEDFQDKISYDRFWSALHGETWQNVDTSMITNIEIDNHGSKILELQ